MTSTDDTRYLAKDLHDYASKPSGYEQHRRHRKSREDVIQDLLPDSATIEYYRTGGYQGTMGLVIKLRGYYWLIKEAYGSCSYCDGLLAADDRYEYGLSMLRNAYAFDSAADADLFLRDQDGYMWDKIRGEMRELVADMSTE